MLEALDPAVTVRLASPESLAAMPPCAASTLRRRAIFLRVETRTQIVEDRDARVEVGVERGGRPVHLVLPREHALAALAQSDERSERARARLEQDADDAIGFAPVDDRDSPSLLRSLADGIQVGYAMFIVPFVMTTTLIGHELPTVERPRGDEDERREDRASESSFAALARVLESGGCSLALGGGCARWLVLPRTSDDASAAMALSFAVRLDAEQRVVLRVPLPSATSIEARVRAAFPSNEPRSLLRAADASYTSICERRDR